MTKLHSWKIKLLFIILLYECLQRIPGKQMMKWLDGIINSMNMSLS